MALAGKVCVVTGATRGIGKGIALQLGQAGATVYITGRTQAPSSVPGSLAETAEQIKERGGKCIPVVCDHSNDDDVKRLFEKIKVEQDGQLDLLVNNAYAAVQTIIDSRGKKFWELDAAESWDAVNNVGLRNHYLCTVYASRLMVERKKGLIINVSSAGGLRYLFNVAYGVGKAAVDRLAADCAHELRRDKVACVSLWPGPVGTELIMEATAKAASGERSVFTATETPEFSGLVIVGLMQDPNIMQKSGRILIAAELALEYGLKDINGEQVPSMRQINYLLNQFGYKKIATVIPNWLKLPYWALSLAGSKF